MPLFGFEPLLFTLNTTLIKLANTTYFPFICKGTLYWAFCSLSVSEMHSLVINYNKWLSRNNHRRGILSMHQQQKLKWSVSNLILHLIASSVCCRERELKMSDENCKNLNYDLHIHPTILNVYCQEYHIQKCIALTFLHNTKTNFFSGN